MEIDRQDFIKAMGWWYWALDEINATDDIDFHAMLKKYSIDLEEAKRATI